MAKWHKYSLMAGHSLENAIRLHLDSVKLFYAKSYPTAYQLSILSKEEIGKSLMLEEMVFRVAVEKTWDVDMQKDFLRRVMSSHSTKQRWFGRTANDFLNRHGALWASAQIRQIFEGEPEKNKQDSTYVGLTRDRRGRPDFNGRLVVPTKKITRNRASDEITLVNDFLLVYAEGYSRNMFATDSPETGELYNQNLVKTLESTWTTQTALTKSILLNIKSNPVTDNAHSWFE